MLASLLLPALLCAAPAEGEAVPLSSRITEVVVHGDSARVRRSAQVERSGVHLLAGLPGSLDPDAIRVRIASGSVVGVEVVDRWQQAVPDAELQALRERLDALQWQRRELEDKRRNLTLLRTHVAGLLSQQSDAVRQQTATAQPDPAAWARVLAFAAEQLSALDDKARAAERAQVDLDTSIADVEAQLGRLQARDRVHLRDVLVDVLVDRPAAMDVEYLVAEAGWRPLYDLRTAADGTSVDLSYRAQVWQQTGEEWSDVALVLSTAQPQRGAQGPDPVPVRLRIASPRPAAAPAAELSKARTELARGKLAALGYVGDEAEEPASTVVLPQGLSVQFRLPRPETISSRDRPSTVLVGEQKLAVSLERVCVPALDTTVWVRGLTKNATPWTMLPGAAAVYFGQDYVGQSWFGEPVLPEQEFTLHLGADQGLKVERVKTDELHEEPGLFSKRQVDTLAWRVRLSNLGATPARADGSVDVLVREAIPQPADERIEVELGGESHRALTDERWLKDNKEKGIRTWLVPVGKGSTADVTFRVTTRWPEKTALEAGS
jgi:uncharacterized protein (TIGR02231 family)